MKIRRNTSQDAIQAKIKRQIHDLRNAAFEIKERADVLDELWAYDDYRALARMGIITDRELALVLAERERVYGHSKSLTELMKEKKTPTRRNGKRRSR